MKMTIYGLVTQNYNVFLMTQAYEQKSFGLCFQFEYNLNMYFLVKVKQTRLMWYDTKFKDLEMSSIKS